MMNIKVHLLPPLSFRLTLTLFAILLTVQCQQTWAAIPAADSEDVCRYFSNNTVIRDPESCNKYITCIDFISNYKECTGSTPFFDKDKGSCVKTLPDESTCHVSCINSTAKFVPDPKSCKGYYYCHDEEFATPGKCPDSTHFNETRQSCVYKQESTCTVEQFKFCAIVQNGVNFRDEKYCHKYYTCAKGQKISKTCLKKYYDPIKGACVDKATVQCVEHPLPKEVCGTAKKAKKNYFAEDDATCAGYFFCAETKDGSPDPSPKWAQCPPDLFFSVTKQACVSPLEVQCEWDRCDGRTLPFVTSDRKGCRHYLRCRDGIVAEELTCGNLFFDEKKGICTEEIINEIACKS